VKYASRLGPLQRIPERGGVNHGSGYIIVSLVLLTCSGGGGGDKSEEEASEVMPAARRSPTSKYRRGASCEQGRAGQ